MLTQLEAFVPTVLAILSIALFTERTRTLCYIVALLSIIAELIPIVLNPIALVACTACLLSLLIADFMLHEHAADKKHGKHGIAKHHEPVFAK